MDQVVGREEILDLLAQRYGPVHPTDGPSSAPAERFVLPDGTRIGIIASTTAPFCRSCDRSRLTADGTWLLCLYGENGLDLREPLRQGLSDGEIADRIRQNWIARADRGAELRRETAGRSALYQLESLRADPHREMHTRGG
jgi:cyclic pyranopterin phosphate synthase